jgi:hypothetical protein
MNNREEIDRLIVHFVQGEPEKNETGIVAVRILRITAVEKFSAVCFLLVK